MLKPLALLFVSALALQLATAHAGDIDAGRQVYKRCTACHSDGDDNRLGPSLVSVVGRSAGTAQGYSSYSMTVKEAGKKGMVWTKETLDRYLQNRTQFYGGGHRCIGASVADQKDRDNLIAYLTELPKLAAANAAAQQTKLEEDRKREALAKQEFARRRYQEQLLRAAEARDMGAGPGSFSSVGFLRPRMLQLAYEGRFEELAPEDFPVEYYYRFSEAISGKCKDTSLGSARARYGTDLLQLGFDKSFQQEALDQTLKTILEMRRNPGALIARAAEKEAALKAGLEDGERFVQSHRCEQQSGVAKRMYSNVGAVLSGNAPVYVDNPKKPE
jgi:cytochrome c